MAAAEGMRGDTPVFADEIFGFLAQQCVEKSLKAWISLLYTPYPRTHDIVALLKILASAGESIEAYRSLPTLEAYAVTYRYESLRDNDENPLDRTDTLAQVRTLFDTVHQRMADARGSPEP